MNILGIESSCDETAAAVVQGGQTILSSVVASQVPVHAGYGGVVPELASREHVDNICFVVERCLEEAGLNWKQIDGIAVTRGPGLIGALLVGLSYAKGLSYSLHLPFLGVNHLEGHLSSILLDHPEAEFPALALVVSGGHTSLFHRMRPGHQQEIARTRDDAAGEALDKLSKHLGLGYPGGPVLDRLSPDGDPEAFPFSLPRMNENPLDFSFSGIKTAALRYMKEKAIHPVSEEAASPPQPILDLVASYQGSIVNQLLDRIERSLEGRQVSSIQISGGVSCNSELRRRTHEAFEGRGIPVYFPRPELTTDNAAMIAAAGFAQLRSGASDQWSLTADPNLPVQSTKIQPN